MMKSILFFCILVQSTLFSLALAADELSPEQLEFFENKIRPVLIENCYKCHTVEGGQRGGLLLDSRQGWQDGGDTGPVIVQGNAEESALIQAIRYTDPDFQMPPDGPLPETVIRDFEVWVKMGAPDPRVEEKPERMIEKFNLKERGKFWCFQPVKKPPFPDVQDELWIRNPIDRFILSRLEDAGLHPVSVADRRTLIRRLTYTLTGLPPTPEEVEAFLKDSSPHAYENLVDRLLASPHFGERWARHWMDVVRYAESKGHEGDYSIANAWHYRDYLIRAFNTDVPYDLFVKEHIAGDLLKSPRLNPESGFNESALGTAFFHLGDGTHSPVDIRQNEVDRIANMVDVTTKTFLGLTVACARCHDHKFDPISTKDYYALYSVIESSRSTNSELYPVEKTRKTAETLKTLKPRIREAFVSVWSRELEDVGQYLLPTAQVLDEANRARHALDVADEMTTDVSIADFEGTDYNGWQTTGDAFGVAPAQGALKGQREVKGFNGKGLVNSFLNGDKAQGTLTSPPFSLERNYINFLIGGGKHTGKTCINLLVDDQVVKTAVGANNEALVPLTWDVSELQGKSARIQLVDAHSGGWGHINLDDIILSDRPTADVPIGNFKDKDHAGWEVTGEVIGTAPAKENLEGQADSSSQPHEDNTHATMTSPPFQINHNFINFRIVEEKQAKTTTQNLPTGSMQPEDSSRWSLNLLVENAVMQTETGSGRERSTPASWDVSRFRGQNARLQIVNKHSGDWEHINFNHIVLSHRPHAGYFVNPAITRRIAENAGLAPTQLARWTKVLSHPKVSEANHPLSAWLKLASNDDTAWQALKQEETAKVEEPEQERAEFDIQTPKPVTLGDFRRGSYGDWFVEGIAFTESPSTRGAVGFRNAAQVIDGFLPSGAFSNSRSPQLAGTLRSPTFTLEHDFIDVYAMGRGFQLRTIINNFQLIRSPLYGGLEHRNAPADEMRWYRFNVKRWKGHRAYVEILHNAGSDNFVGVQQVIMHNGEPPKESRVSLLQTHWKEGDSHLSPQSLGQHFSEIAQAALTAWDSGAARPEQLSLLNVLIQGKLLSGTHDVTPEIRKLMTVYQDAKMQIPAVQISTTAYGQRSSQQVIGMTDGNGLDGVVFIGGNYRKPGDTVPRRFLEILAGSDQPFNTDGSGRIEMAHAIAMPDNPLTARVMVNRVWHHLFGSGIVATVDNFGKLGDSPTHPELLDYLANRFAEEGWSIKQLIRLIVNSNTYRMSSHTTSDAREVDPNNRLLHSMRIRRLEPEAIRDGILAVSGRLDRKMYGAGIPVHLTRFMEGRGRPGESGPLDGEGRRSLYIALRRNFLPPMMLAFDMPVPFSTFGRRNVTNVPAQSLTLMNDTFVVNQAEFWATQILEQKLLTPTQKIRRMYQQAFGREPLNDELKAGITFLHNQAQAYGITEANALDDKRVWKDLCHALFNLKEFIYIF